MRTYRFEVMRERIETCSVLVTANNITEAQGQVIAPPDWYIDRPWELEDIDPAHPPGAYLSDPDKYEVVDPIKEGLVEPEEMPLQFADLMRLLQVGRPKRDGE